MTGRRSASLEILRQPAVHDVVEISHATRFELFANDSKRSFGKVNPSNPTRESRGWQRASHGSIMRVPESKSMLFANFVHRVHHVIERRKVFHSIDHIFQSLTDQRMTHV